MAREGNAFAAVGGAMLNLNQGLQCLSVFGSGSSAASVTSRPAHDHHQPLTTTDAFSLLSPVIRSVTLRSHSPATLAQLKHLVPCVFARYSDVSGPLFLACYAL